jgi:peptide/nickel transport system permease protein
MIALRRIVQMAGLLAVLSVLLFHLLHVMPGSAEDALIAQSAEMSAADLERLQKLRGLDRPVSERYVCWLFGHGDRGADDRCAYWPSRGVLFGDLGFSRVHKVPVAEILGQRIASTLTLSIPSFIIAVLASILFGTIAAVRRGAIERWMGAIASIGVALPAHWLSMITILVGALWLGLFPASGMEDARSPGLLSRVHHAILPVSVLAFLYASHWTRYVRSSLLEVLSQDYVRTARALGLTERRVILRHALPNALIPIVTVLAQSLPGLFSGALVIETVFAYPGMGVLILESVQGRDHLVAMVVFLAIAAITMIATLLADLSYRAIDPRVRTEGAA